MYGGRGNDCACWVRIERKLQFGIGCRVDIGRRARRGEPDERNDTISVGLHSNTRRWRRIQRRFRGRTPDGVLVLGTHLKRL